MFKCTTAQDIVLDLQFKQSKQDVLELRTANWVARREEAGPKTIEQIHKVSDLEDDDDDDRIIQC